MSDVGYKKPPVAHQFKAGKSGNPKGGKRGPRKVKSRPHPFDAKVKIRFGAKLQTMTIGRQLILVARNIAIQKSDTGLSRDLRKQHIRIYELSKKKKLDIIRIKDDAEWIKGDPITNTTDAVQHLGIGRLLRPYTKKPRTMLEPFIVQAAIDRMEPDQLTRDQQRRVIDTTRKAWKLNLPRWWAPDISGVKRASTEDDQ